MGENFPTFRRDFCLHFGGLSEGRRVPEGVTWLGNINEVCPVVDRRKSKRVKWEVREALDFWVDDFPITKSVTPNLDSYGLSWYQFFVVFLSVLRLRSVKRLERISSGKCRCIPRRRNEHRRRNIREKNEEVQISEIFQVATAVVLKFKLYSFHPIVYAQTMY